MGQLVLNKVKERESRPRAGLPDPIVKVQFKISQ